MWLLQGQNSTDSTVGSLRGTWWEDGQMGHLGIVQLQLGGDNFQRHVDQSVPLHVLGIVEYARCKGCRESGSSSSLTSMWSMQNQARSFRNLCQDTHSGNIPKNQLHLGSNRGFLSLSLSAVVSRVQQRQATHAVFISRYSSWLGRPRPEALTPVVAAIYCFTMAFIPSYM